MTHLEGAIGDAIEAEATEAAVDVAETVAEVVAEEAAAEAIQEVGDRIERRVDETLAEIEDVVEDQREEDRWTRLESMILESENRVLSAIQGMGPTSSLEPEILEPEPETVEVVAAPGAEPPEASGEAEALAFDPEAGAPEASEQQPAGRRRVRGLRSKRA